MNVYTYCDPVPGLFDSELLALWRASWYTAGFRPIVLDTPMTFTPEQERYFTAHSDNPPGYQLATIRKWAAAARVREPFVLMVDWDVFPTTAMSMDALPRRQVHHFKDGDPAFYVLGDNAPGVGLNTGALYGEPCQYRAFAEFMLGQARDGTVCEHCHDEDILRHTKRALPYPILRVDACPTRVQAQAWTRTPPMIHFTNGTTPSPRVATIAAERDRWCLAA